MFGTLKPRLCVLQDDARATYDRYYCGLCKGLGDHYGQLTRGLLSQDAVFMALLADALADAPAERSRCRCPILPVVHRPTVAPGSVAMRYAAAVQVLLGDQLLADRAMDGRRAYGAARRWIAGHVAVARAMLAELGLDTAALEGFEHRQARCERDGTSADEAAAPTADALAHVFASLADLPGMPAGARSPDVRASLGALGAGVGRAIYFRDALEDLRDDLLGGAFNPCLVKDASGVREISPARVESVAASLEREVDGFGARLAALPLARHAGILRNILCVEFGAKARAAVTSARKDADEVVRALWASAARRPWYDRALVRVALVALAAWSWVLQTAVAFAQPRKLDAGVPRDGGVSWFDAGVQKPPVAADGGVGGGSHGACGDGPKNRCDGVCEGCIQAVGCERACKGATKDCCDASCRICHCNDCAQGKPCTNCGRSCDECCTKPCNDCGRCCGDCGKPCGDCGRCCNDCGHGCDNCNHTCSNCRC